MKRIQESFIRIIAVVLFYLPLSANAQVVITQYYEGGGTNKWIELTNLGNSSVNLSSPQLKLGLWAVTGSTGNITFTGSASNTYSLTSTIPAKGSILIGNSSNGTEVPYLTAGSANETSNSVINFNGNDGVALLDASNNIIDKFGEGINAADISYVRSTSITGPNATYTASEWTNTSLSAVQSAGASTSPRLGYQLPPLCVAPSSQATSLNFSSVTSSSMNGSFTAATADGYVVIQSTSSSLSANPVDATTYSVGNSIGGGTVVSSGSSTSFSTSGLSSNTTYYFFVFDYNNNSCSNGPKYLTVTPLSGSQATPYPPCTTPSSQPTSLSFSSVTSSSMNGSFTASTADGYVVVQSTSSSLSANPVDATTYSVGNSIGGGTVVSSGSSTSFSTSGLSSNTTYYFFVFAYNNSSCTGGPKYLTVSPLSGSQATPYPPCATPSSQPTSLSFSSVTSSSMNGSFTAGTASGYTVVQSTSSSLSGSPVDATTYSVGNSIGGGTVVSSSASTSFSTSGLSSNTTYYFFVFAYNNSSCTGGPKYLTTSPLSGSQATPYPPCSAPSNSATSMVFSSVTSTSMTTSFTGTSGVDGYLVVRSTSSSLSANPSNGTAYTAGNSLGGGTVLSAGTGTSVNSTSLSPSTTYYFYVFTYNNVNCTGAPAYKTTALTGNRATDDAALNYYFGNLHAHSSYSDGNKENTSKTPADDYAFAKNAMCMDFLGISEHNHSGAGMHVADWQPGITQATAATTSTFIAMHGQEWGVIGTQGSAGDHEGHVIVYGLDSLAGWESGNYQINVPQTSYVGSGGLFDIINRHGNNAFATLAHPDNYDYNDILHSTYNSAADDAIVGSCVETGPAFSTDTSYTDPSSLSFYAFYKNMLGKGYHLGPTMDHDNHYLTFGKTAKTRLCVLATSLSEANILDAMRKMRFYATEDCGAKINFTINTTYPLGSIITKAGAPVINVTTITGSSVSSIKLMHGVPGSGSAATTLTSTTSSSLSYTHTALANLATEYYFLDITESDGTRIITAPIWYTRDNSASRPAFVTSFFTINEADRVILKWTATKEPAGESYEIQRSIDGRNFISIGNANGKEQSQSSETYVIEDNAPVNGLAYYRLVNKNGGAIAYSELKTVNRGTLQSKFVIAYPNPVKNMLNIKIATVQNENTRVNILDMSGRILKSIPVKLNSGEQILTIDVSTLNSGTYMLKTSLAGKMQVQMISKL